MKPSLAHTPPLVACRSTSIATEGTFAGKGHAADLVCNRLRQTYRVTADEPIAILDAWLTGPGDVA